MERFTHLLVRARPNAAPVREIDGVSIGEDENLLADVKQ